MGRRAGVFAVAVAFGLSSLAVAASGATRPTGASPAASGACKPATIGGKRKCLAVGQKCSTRYQAAYRKYGFVCKNGRLRKRTTAPPPVTPPPPPPPPPPPATPGHYTGKTSQNEQFDFDVTADGRGFASLKTGQVNEGCTPYATIYGGNWTFNSSPYPIDASGTFKIDFAFTGAVSGAPSNGHLTIDGHFNGATAQGTLLETLNFTYQGTTYSCTSGPQTWLASRTG
jgi:hypothetical protein